MGLMNNQSYTLKVKEMQAAADSFENKVSGGRSYCHYITLADENGELFYAQICDGFASQSYCNVGDIVKVKIKVFTRDRYTLESIAVVNHTVPASNNNAPAPLSNNNPVKSSINTHVAGKASSVAINAAVSYYANRPVSNEKNPASDIITLSEELYKFLISKEQ